MHLRGALEKNQGTFCKKQSLSAEIAGQMRILEDGRQFLCCAEDEVSGKKKIVFAEMGVVSISVERRQNNGKEVEKIAQHKMLKVLMTLL